MSYEMHYRLQLVGPSVEPACLLKVLSDSVTTGFTVPLYSQYYINLQSKKKEHLRISCTCMMTYHTGLLEKCRAIIQGVKQAILSQMRYLCKAEDAFCPQVQKSAAEVISVLEVL